MRFYGIISILITQLLGAMKFESHGYNYLKFQIKFKYLDYINIRVCILSLVSRKLYSI